MEHFAHLHNHKALLSYKPSQRTFQEGTWRNALLFPKQVKTWMLVNNPQVPWTPKRKQFFYDESCLASIRAHIYLEYLYLSYEDWARDNLMQTLLSISIKLLILAQTRISMNSIWRRSFNTLRNISGFFIYQTLLTVIFTQWSISSALPQTLGITRPPPTLTLLTCKSRWSVARTFPPGRFLNLILAHRGEVYILNEARHRNTLVGGKFSLYFYPCRGIFYFSWKYDDVNNTYF